MVVDLIAMVLHSIAMKVAGTRTVLHPQTCEACRVAYWHLKDVHGLTGKRGRRRGAIQDVVKRIEAAAAYSPAPAVSMDEPTYESDDAEYRAVAPVV